MNGNNEDIMVSVIIASYGRPEKLRCCLKKLMQQDLKQPWQIIIVDDGSPMAISEVTLCIRIDANPDGPMLHITRPT